MTNLTWMRFDFNTYEFKETETQCVLRDSQVYVSARLDNGSDSVRSKFHPDLYTNGIKQARLNEFQLYPDSASMISCSGEFGITDLISRTHFLKCCMRELRRRRPRSFARRADYKSVTLTYEIRL